jgi:hypothetical protein
MIGKKISVPYKFTFLNPINYNCVWKIPIDGKTWKTILERSINTMKDKGVIPLVDESLEKFDLRKEYVPQVRIALMSAMKQAVRDCKNNGMTILDWQIEKCAFEKKGEDWTAEVLLSGDWSR